MNSVNEIVTYLEALAHLLVERGVKAQFHLLIAGGAYMLLQQQRRSTHDIDFAQIIPPRKVRPNEIMDVELQHGGEIAMRSSHTVFSQVVKEMAATYSLPADWLNDECASYLYLDISPAEAYFWRSFSNVLFAYLPSAEYMFMLKIVGYRQKDQADIKRLIGQLGVQSREQAQAIMDRFLLPEAQAFYEIEKRLKRIFR